MSALPISLLALAVAGAALIKSHLNGQESKAMAQTTEERLQQALTERDEQDRRFHEAAVGKIGELKDSLVERDSSIEALKKRAEEDDDSELLDELEQLEAGNARTKAAADELLGIVEQGPTGGEQPGGEQPGGEQPGGETPEGSTEDESTETATSGSGESSEETDGV